MAVKTRLQSDPPRAVYIDDNADDGGDDADDNVNDDVDENYETELTSMKMVIIVATF